MTRCGVYVRVSDDGQDEELQVGECRRYAAALGWDVAGIWRSHGRTGRRDREEHEEFIRAGVRREFDVAVYWKVSRAHRNVAHFVRDWFRLDAAHVRRAYVADALDSQGPFATAIATLLAELAEMESRNISDNVRMRVREKRSRAQNLGVRAKWARGYLATLDQEGAARRLLGQGRSIRRVAAAVGLGRSAVHRLSRTLPPRRERLPSETPPAVSKDPSGQGAPPPKESREVRGGTPVG